MKTDTTVVRSRVFPLAEARRSAKTIDGKRLATVAECASLRLLCSFPLRPNEQTPHEQDELYVVVCGRGVLFHDGKREPFTAGDAIFIAAGVEHHFEDFSEDLSVWVAFHGPKGGDQGERDAGPLPNPTVSPRPANT